MHLGAALHWDFDTTMLQNSVWKKVVEKIEKPTCVRRATTHSSSTARAAPHRPAWYARKPSLKRSRNASFTAHVLGQ